MDLKTVKRIEKEHFEKWRAGDGPLPPVDVEEMRRLRLSPCFETGKDKYSDNLMAFHELIIRDGGWKDKCVLDYACGSGDWAVYFALTGARKVVGFDIAETGIRRGMERVRSQGLADKVELTPMDAGNLTFPDNTFDIVIGAAVLHHVMKYPGVFEHLHRVMKPGAKAYFLEGLADYPLFKLWWKIKGAVPSGDVPIFANQVRRKTHMFSGARIVGDCFLYAVKAFHRKKRRPSLPARLLLRACKQADQVLFRLVPRLRNWGSFTYLVLTK